MEAIVSMAVETVAVLKSNVRRALKQLEHYGVLYHGQRRWACKL